MEDIKKKWAVIRDGIIVGSTYAISAEQAINNVRYNVYGEYESQYDAQHTWDAYNDIEMDKEESRKEYLKRTAHNEAAIKHTWLPIPADGDVNIKTEKFRYFPVIKGEPDEIAQGTVNGIECYIGFGAFCYKPLKEDPVQERKEELDNQMSLFELGDAS